MAEFTNSTTLAVPFKDKKGHGAQAVTFVLACHNPSAATHEKKYVGYMGIGDPSWVMAFGAKLSPAVCAAHFGLTKEQCT